MLSLFIFYSYGSKEVITALKVKSYENRNASTVLHHCDQGSLQHVGRGKDSVKTYDKKEQGYALFMQAQLGLGGGFTSLIIIWMCSFIDLIQLHCSQHIKNRTAFVPFPLQPAYKLHKLIF